mgnify:CR=1 FL=1
MERSPKFFNSHSGHCRCRNYASRATSPMRSVWTYLLGSESTLRELHRQSNVRTSTNTLKKSALLSGGHSEWPTEKRKVLRQRKNRHKKAPLKPLSATKEQNTKKSADCESALEEAATYSPTTKCSTIGVNGLNFSVRNGKRWNPIAITT